MALDTAKVLPFGLRDVGLKSLGADNATPGSLVDLPVAQIFSFSEAETYADLTGDDTTQATHGAGPTVEWELQAGGIPVAAYALMAGGTVTSVGTTPNVVQTYSKLITDLRPYFKAEGQAISDNGGDMHGLVYRCKATGNIEGKLEYGTFWVTKAKGVGYGSLETAKLGKLYDFIHNETAVAIS